MTAQIQSKNNEQIKEENRKKLLKLSENSIGVIPQLEEPTEEQKDWVLRNLRRSM
ncbi:hypothetical protein BH18THE1_BH18THE1_03430 [soil metagenome]